MDNELVIQIYIATTTIDEKYRKSNSQIDACMAELYDLHCIALSHTPAYIQDHRQWKSISQSVPAHLPASTANYT